MEGGTAVTEGGTVLSLGTAGLVISGGGGGQKTVPVTPEEASADAAALGSLLGNGGNGASVTGSGSGGGNGSAGSSGPVVFTGGASERRSGVGWGGVLMLMGLSFVLMELGLGWG